MGLSDPSSSAEPSGTRTATWVSPNQQAILQGAFCQGDLHYWKVYAIPSLARNGFVKNITGGWELSAIGILQSGSPFSVVTTAPYPRGDFNADGQNYDAPNTPSVGNSKSSSPGDFQSGIFSASAFPLPPAGQQGNLGRQYIRRSRFGQRESQHRKEHQDSVVCKRRG